MIVKRMVSMLLALSLILSLGACSKSSDDNSKGENQDKSASQETPDHTEDTGADQRKQPLSYGRKGAVLMKIYFRVSRIRRSILPLQILSISSSVK